ncbi:retrovirus-related pol polyprotein from transposon, partial [Cystoisospora suis]
AACNFAAFQQTLPLRDQSSARVVQEQRADDECRAVVRAICTGNEGFAPRWWQLLPRFLRGSYITYDGILYKQGEAGALRIFVPKALRDSLVWSYHSGPLGAHLGSDRIYSQLRRRYSWPGMREDIKRLVQGCLS